VASSITDLINNIQDSISTLVAGITGANTGGVPSYHYNDSQFKQVQSQINQANWSKLSFPYTFSVINLTKTSDNGGFGDFALPIAPQAINQGEEPAISIKATQGGTSTTHAGMRYKSLSIQGTTGIAPFRGDGGVDERTGEAIFQPAALKYKSGYEVFLHLRNWFRTYYEYKKVQGATASGLRLLFKNYKDGEFLIVELLKFEMDRNAAKPFMYDYKIEFKVLGHFQFANQNNNDNNFETVIEDGLDKINYARGVFLRSAGILRQIESTYDHVVVQPLRQTTLAVKALNNVPLVAADVGSSIIRNTVSEANTLAICLGIQSQQTDNKTSGTLDPTIAAIPLPTDLSATVTNQGNSIIDTFGEGLMALDFSIFPEVTRDATLEEQTNAQSLPRSFYTDLINNIIRVKNNAEDFFNLGDPTYDSLFNRTATLSADPNKVATSAELDVLDGFNQALNGLYLWLSSQDLFKSSFDARIQDMINRFDGNIQLFSSPAVKQVRFAQGMTLERLAQQELGDSDRWGEIVEVNDLKPPFVTDDITDTRSNLVKPGDIILIPIPLQNGFSNAPKGAENKDTVNLTELEKSLGVDFKLSPTYDLTLTNSGDLDLIAGVQNLAQAVVVKLSYEPGELIRHPEIGAGVVPGKKFPAIEDIKDGVINTLLQDTRIQKVDNLSLTQDGSSLFLNFNLKIKSVDVPVPISVKVA
jgi:hypothetical protein